MSMVMMMMMMEFCKIFEQQKCIKNYASCNNHQSFSSLQISEIPSAVFELAHCLSSESVC